jgi:histidyl-tRNA synthetase
VSKLIQAIRGMNDVLPAESIRWRQLESDIIDVLSAYGYDEIRLPIVEQSAVFRTSIGDATDIVQKEMYSFDDRNGDNLTLRPEGTAGCVRAVLQHGLLQQLPRRLWYMGPMFRHERPQRGRQRQFHQIGVEVFGADEAGVDAELILLSARMWRALGLRNLRLELNSLGSATARSNYRATLSAYFRQHLDTLDDDSRDRLERNPLRILDSKNPDMRELIGAAPILSEHLDVESRDHFQQLLDILADNGIEAEINPRLVRGLDYYSRTVFEWITTELGAQGTVCAGGRYDGLVEIMGGKAVTGIGFAMGLERLLELRTAQSANAPVTEPDLYILATSDALARHAIALGEQLRDEFPHWTTISHIGGGSVKSRMKKADRSGAAIALILGDDEVANNAVTVKPLRSGSPQLSCPLAELSTTLKRLLLP